MKITPTKTVFVIISFEGPDVYSQAGGLGVRVRGLSRTLSQLGFYTHLFFVGECGYEPFSGFITATYPRFR